MCSVEVQWGLPFTIQELRSALAYGFDRGMSLRVATNHPGADEVLEVQHDPRNELAGVRFTIYRPVSAELYGIFSNRDHKVQYFNTLLDAVRCCRKPSGVSRYVNFRKWLQA